jgi:hypothetical protein
VAARAQAGPPRQAQPASRRTRLILKDGSYQIVKGYQIKGSVVQYTSAERGELEEVPADLVDWDATHKWERDHDPEANAPPQSDQDDRTAAREQQSQRTVLDADLAREEADRATRTPLVAPNLRLPETGSAFALDIFRDTPELVPLPQTGGDLNPLNSHSTVKLPLNPLASPHPIVTLKGEGSDYQMHVASPVFYLRVGNDTGAPIGGGDFTVDTHGAGPAKDDPSGGSEQSRYVILRADVRVGARLLNSFSLATLGDRPQPDVIDTSIALLPGGHWIAITPKQPLEFGEYALVEVLNDHTLNGAVWDFGVHSQRGDNRDSLKPEVRRPPSLGRHTQP